MLRCVEAASTQNFVYETAQRTCFTGSEYNVKSNVIVIFVLFKIHQKNEYVRFILHKVAAILGLHDQLHLQIQLSKHKLTSSCHILQFREHLSQSHSLNISLIQNKENMYRLKFCMVAEYFSDRETDKSC